MFGSIRRIRQEESDSVERIIIRCVENFIYLYHNLSVVEMQLKINMMFMARLVDVNEIQYFCYILFSVNCKI